MSPTGKRKWVGGHIFFSLAADSVHLTLKTVAPPCLDNTVDCSLGNNCSLNYRTGGDRLKSSFSYTGSAILCDRGVPITRNAKMRSEVRSEKRKLTVRSTSRYTPDCLRSTLIIGEAEFDNPSHYCHMTSINNCLLCTGVHIAAFGHLVSTPVACSRQ